jgi:hypothetical protein
LADTAVHWMAEIDVNAKRTALPPSVASASSAPVTENDVWLKFFLDQTSFVLKDPTSAVHTNVYKSGSRLRRLVFDYVEEV